MPDYQAQNGGLITDTEDSSKVGFTGATYTDRAVHFGFPGSQTVTSSGAALATTAKRNVV
ncbi:hypothetical protein BZM27_54025 [Paraburkholderia steynii]|uniref:Uncharacterized protein n=1 Tax=Paraburkholderia steynii TaxID=1245441 RepID=A0A4R0X5M5_9BURK|nr:hypothetical protein BZM27_54025 [Paraburkholderia steynii]